MEDVITSRFLVQRNGYRNQELEVLKDVKFERIQLKELS